MEWLAMDMKTSRITSWLFKRQLLILGRYLRPLIPQIGASDSIGILFVLNRYFQSSLNIKADLSNLKILKYTTNFCSYWTQFWNFLKIYNFYNTWPIQFYMYAMQVQYMYVIHLRLTIQVLYLKLRFLISCLHFTSDMLIHVIIINQIRS